jgi:hypothetical protein
MRCLVCDALVDRSWRWCPECGTRVELRSPPPDSSSGGAASHLGIVSRSPCPCCGKSGGFGFVVDGDEVIEGRHVLITGPCPQCHPAGATMSPTA